MFDYMIFNTFYITILSLQEN